MSIVIRRGAEACRSGEDAVIEFVFVVEAGLDDATVAEEVLILGLLDGTKGTDLAGELYKDGFVALGRAVNMEALDMAVLTHLVTDPLHKVVVLDFMIEVKTVEHTVESGNDGELFAFVVGILALDLALLAADEPASGGAIPSTTLGIALLLALVLLHSDGRDDTVLVGAQTLTALPTLLSQVTLAHCELSSGRRRRLIGFVGHRRIASSKTETTMVLISFRGEGTLAFRLDVAHSRGRDDTGSGILSLRGWHSR